MEERERKERVPFQFLSRSRFFPFLSTHISSPGGLGGPRCPQGLPYAPGFYGAAFTPKVKVDAPDKFDGRPTKVKPYVWLTEVERWFCLC